GTLSEAAQVFDAALLQEVMSELALRVQAQGRTLPEDRQLLEALTAVDGSLLPALPRMTWALWQDRQHRAAKLHLAFAVLRRLSTEHHRPLQRYPLRVVEVTTRARHPEG